ncbi:MAG: rhomboid family intramembrane serine protease [Anaeromyxobacter sp.]
MPAPAPAPPSPWTPLAAVALLIAAAHALPGAARPAALLVLFLAGCPLASARAARRAAARLPDPPGAPAPVKEERAALAWLRNMAALAGAVVPGGLYLLLRMLLAFPDRGAEALFPLLLLALVAGLVPGAWRDLRLMRARRAAGLSPIPFPDWSELRRRTGLPFLEKALGHKAWLGVALVGATMAVSLTAHYLPAVAAWLVRDPARLQAGQVWRLLTGALVHGGPAQASAEFLALLAVTTAAELILGWRRALVLFLGGQLAGAVAGALLAPAPGLGAAAGLAALTAALAGFCWRHRPLLTWALRTDAARAAALGALVLAGVGLGAAGVDAPTVAAGALVGALAGTRLSAGPALRVALEHARAVEAADPAALVVAARAAA